MGAEAADLSTPRGTRLGVIVLVGLLHVAALLGLIRAFAPDFTAQVTRTVLSTFTVTVVTPPPAPAPSKEPERAGAAAEAGKKAVAREVKAEKPRVELARAPAPKAASTGSANTSGAQDAGAGTGAGGQGSGTGSGTGGTGSGGGLTRKVEKTAGEINSARDYPRETRDLRKDDYVIVAITVSAAGKPTACRIHRPSKDAQANAITCTLALQRFRFKPATDAQGNPVASTYGWRQRWYE
ncbi:TonB family protein [Novosphingobium sp.]|uniref:TonB family protein n=1 Tax=Novosphingobium sp. TaxID=1874826 RepID=UPI002737043D|nr:TonB family protein [Novosphingobium sp.]MDP3907932.1 TonB family protein [Novosphingobium sp.]